MAKNTLSQNQSDIPKSNTKDSLVRRAIHTKTQHVDENKKEKFDNDLDSSPSKYEKLYPNIPDEDDTNSEEEFDMHNEDDEKQKSWNLFSAFNVKYFIAILLVIVVGCFFLPPSSSPTKTTKLSLKEKLNHIKNNFQDQNYLTFRILEKALEKVVNVTATEPSAPAIFTIVVNENAVFKSHEFLHSLASTLAPQNTVFINESKPWHSKPDDIKFKIDNDILSVANEKELFVVIVDNLQNIPLTSSMIFHSYCDHESAPFKHAVFLFVVPLNKNLPENSSSKEIDKVAWQQFKTIWKKASADEIDSLITRITVNVINFR